MSETQLIISKESPSSDYVNRLVGMAEDYTPSKEEVDFDDCETLEEVVDILSYLESKYLHLVDSRGYVYHSTAMRQLVEKVIEDGELDFDVRLLTRTAGLRQAVIAIYLDSQ